MKTPVFLALAVAALLLGPWQDRSHGQMAAEDSRPGSGTSRLAPPALPAARPVIPPVPAAAPAPRTSVAARSVAGAGPALPQPRPPAGRPGPGPVASADTASAAPDWRDDALDLLSQIGLLCPAGGCDSLEDD